MFVLIVPTYRSDLQVLANLAYLAALAGEDLGVVISDCSGDAAKREYLSRLASANPHVRVILNDWKVPLFADVCRAVLQDAGSAEFVGICGDDDYVTLTYIRHSLTLLRDDPGVVCSYGSFIVCQSSQNIFVQSPSVMAERAAERISAGFNPNSFNTAWFAVFRRQALVPWTAFCANHPLMAPFFDFIHYISLLAQGKVKTHNLGYYFWTAENWDTPEKNWKSRSRYYAVAGVPDKFVYFHDLHFATECANYLLGKHSPLVDPQERLSCAQVAWDICINRFRIDLGNNRQFFRELLGGRPAPVEALHDIVNLQSCAGTSRIDWFATILGVFSADCASRYRQFDFGISN